MPGENHRCELVLYCPNVAHNAKLVCSRYEITPLLSHETECRTLGLLLPILFRHFHILESDVAFFFFFAGLLKRITIRSVKVLLDSLLEIVAV